MPSLCWHQGYMQTDLWTHIQKKCSYHVGCFLSYNNNICALYHKAETHTTHLNAVAHSQRRRECWYLFDPLHRYSRQGDWRRFWFSLLLKVSRKQSPVAHNAAPQHVRIGYFPALSPLRERTRRPRCSSVPSQGAKAQRAIVWLWKK